MEALGRILLRLLLPRLHVVWLAVNTRRVVGRVHQDDVHALVLPVRQAEAAALADVRVAVAMYEHVRGRKPEGRLIGFDAEDLFLPHMRPLLLGAAVIKRRREGSNEERAASAAWIEHD